MTPGSGRGDRVELAVPHGRHLPRSGDVRVVQLRGFAQAALLTASPPRLRVEHAALMVASADPTADGAVAVLADVVRQGATTTGRLASVLDALARLPRRGLLREALADVAEGAESPLERRYLRDVERGHGLPRGDRQVREVVSVVEGELLRSVVRDVRYAAFATIVELDGRLGHAAALDRWADLGRDLDATVAGQTTLRAGWQQTLDPCRLAVVVGRVLRARGWSGAPRPCGSKSCSVLPAVIARHVECA